ncbi:MAG: isochorismatase family protein [Alcaligenaceae bacterium]|nr:isochorismatase family protein [Alcaligenaceae bacterium]
MLNTQRLSLQSATLLMIDIQERLFPLISNHEEILKKGDILLKGAQALHLKTVIVEQYPRGLGNTIPQFHNNIQDLEKWEKTSFSAAIDHKDAINDLKNKGVDTFIVFGIETHICVYQTAKDLLHSGFHVYLVSDACGSRNTNHHSQALATLTNLGAIVLPTESILFELLVHSKHEAFKTISKLVK